VYLTERGACIQWLPEFDKPLGEAKSLAVYDPATTIYTRSFGAGTTVTFNRTDGRGVISWSDGTVTAGPGCPGTAPRCLNCLPPLYEKGSLAEGTGGCYSS
jgi:hypothetical protein